MLPFVSKRQACCLAVDGLYPADSAAFVALRSIIYSLQKSSCRLSSLRTPVHHLMPRYAKSQSSMATIPAKAANSRNSICVSERFMPAVAQCPAWVRTGLASFDVDLGPAPGLEPTLAMRALRVHFRTNRMLAFVHNLHIIPALASGHHRYSPHRLPTHRSVSCLAIHG